MTRPLHFGVALVAGAIIAAAVFSQPQHLSAGNPTPSLTLSAEGNVNNAIASSANLWYCITGPCNGPGEGTLDVLVSASGISTGDADGDTVPDGAGSYYLDLVQDILMTTGSPSSFTDKLLSPGGAAASVGPPDCGASWLLDNAFDCDATTPGVGASGSFDVVTLHLKPHAIGSLDASPASQRPGVGNEVQTAFFIETCVMDDMSGNGVESPLFNGRLPDCGATLQIAVRLLQADFNVDCHVDVQDQQLAGFRYGSGLESPLYSGWYDVEPNTPDGDIDINDLQRVFGRDGSTCQSPIPAQPPPAG